MSERTPRSNKSRENESRKKSWSRPTMLPTPEPRDGVEYRWVRTSTLGQSDNTNVSSKFREGWTPVKAEDHPELMLQSDHDSKWANDGNIEVGGLLLCKTSVENVEARNQYYAAAAARQVESVDNNYMRESDPRMPKLNESSTRISFGQGRKPD